MASRNCPVVPSVNHPSPLPVPVSPSLRTLPSHARHAQTVGKLIAGLERLSAPSDTVGPMLASLKDASTECVANLEAHPAQARTCGQPILGCVIPALQPSTLHPPRGPLTRAVIADAVPLILIPSTACL